MDKILKNIMKLYMIRRQEGKSAGPWGSSSATLDICEGGRNIGKKLNPEHPVLGLDGQPDGVGDVAVLGDPQQLVWPEQCIHITPV